MKKNQKDKLIWIIVCSIFLLGLITYGVLYFLQNNYGYSHAEKKWISDNVNEVIDIYVQSDLPVFSSNGTGVFYDYLSALEKDTNLSFNIVYDQSTDYSFGLTNKEDNFITFYKDHYVIISKDKLNINNLDYLGDKSVAVLNLDLNSVKQYLSDYRGITYKGYETFSDLKIGLASQNSDLAIVPLYYSMNDILNENYVIDYHIDGFNAFYGINLSKNKEFNGVLSKFYSRWSEKSNEKRNEHLIDLYYKKKNYTELEKSEIVNDDFVVGYMNELPFEGTINNTFTGLTSAYLNGFSELTGATYKYRLYKSIDDLVVGLNKKRVDIVANYYSLGASGYTTSTPFYTGEYVILTHASNTKTFETLSTLADSEVNMLSKMNLTTVMKAKKLFKIKEFDTAKDLFKGIDKESVLIVDKDFYEYYKTKEFKNYVVKYSDNINVKNNFLVISDKSAFSKLFNFYMTLKSDNEMRSISTQKIYGDSKNNIILSFLIKNMIYISLAIILIIVVLYKLAHKIRLSKKIKKEDKLLYIDVMTNLKNRNYLNDNIDYWSGNKVYPQAILIVDLNKVKVLNDKYGHEEGDRQIRSAANALIKTQRENSEIMRTNGNEFMVYLVGYDEKAILSYIHKLTRELNNSLPYKDFGVALGFSMINSELSTIDDAINEALIMMRKNKGETSEK